MITIETRRFEDVAHRQTHVYPKDEEPHTTIDKITLHMPLLAEPEYGQRWVVDVVVRLQEGS